MLLGGYSSCQGCGCVPCKACTRTCTEPHSGDAFEVVYTRKFEGVEAGNPSDGYLTATGDSDSSDPYDGMDGTGPWFQQVGGGFADGGSYGSGTRFPCTYRFSFWRSSYTLGVGTIPPASTALTKNEITLTVSSGAVVFPDGTVITPADGEVELASIPLVSGGALAADPRTGEGTVSFALQCQNVETLFSVQARIEWNTQKRQHVVYGIVRECYEEGTPCATACNGSASPDVVYVTISNAVLPSGTYPAAFPNGTYVLDRYPNFCTIYVLLLENECDNPGDSFTNRVQINGNFSTNLGVLDVLQDVSKDGECGIFTFEAQDQDLERPCGPGVVASGSATWYWVALIGGTVTTISGTRDWEVSA